MDKTSQHKPIRIRDLQILTNVLDQESAFYHRTRAYASRLNTKESVRVAEELSSHHRQCFDAVSDYLSNPF